MELPPLIAEAVEQLASIPGIGPKTALRQVLALSKWDAARLNQFAHAFQDLSELKECPECGIYSDGGPCHICEQEERQAQRSLCVVEGIQDCIAIEKSQSFNGTYFILGGVLNPLLGVGPKELKLDLLFQKILQKNINTLILAVTPSVEGDATCSFICSEVPKTVQVERIGLGIPLGGSLEHLDPRTIGKAIENRKVMT